MLDDDGLSASKVAFSSDLLGASVGSIVGEIEGSPDGAFDGLNDNGDAGFDEDLEKGSLSS